MSPGRLAAAAFAAFATGALAQIQAVPVRPAAPMRVVPVPSAIGVQRAAPVSVQCNQPDLTLCAETDAQRHLLLMGFSSTQLNDEQLERLIRGLEDVNAPARQMGGQTPLGAMVVRGRVKAVNLLLARGADPFARDASGRLALNRSIEEAFSGRNALAPEVLAALRAALDDATKKGLAQPSPLDATLAFRNTQVDLELLALLLDHGADPLYQGQSATPLDLAMRHPDAMRRILATKSRVPGAELDARAFMALAAGNAALFDILRDGGADPARHARAHPQTLFEALRPERPAELVKLVLDAGVDANLVSTAPPFRAALFAANMDAEKLRLLIEHGADVNVEERGSYALLAQVLFNPNRELPQVFDPRRPPAKRTPKLEIVRMLVDAGARVNGDLRGNGRVGALALTRREDPEVIEFLVSRGATLANPQGPQGPVSIALGLDRDDIALALLKRDGKLTPEDRGALPLAVRRGMAQVVSALIAAGADVDAADAQGASALAIAERRRDAAMVKMLSAAGAKAVAAAARPAAHAGDFSGLVAREIDEVAFFDPPRFALYPARDASAVFGFYGSGAGPNQFEQVRCERAAAFEIIAYANQAGGVRVGLCARDARRVRDLAVASDPAIKALLGQLGTQVADPALLAKFGWSYSRTVTRDGAEEHYFALIAIGHGILSLPTLVRTPRGGGPAVVVQMDTMHLCENRGLGTQTPLCTNPRQALADIAQRVQARAATK